MKVLQRRWPLSRIIRDSNPPESFLGNAPTVTRGLTAPSNSTPIFAPRFCITLVLILCGGRSTSISGQEKFNDPVDQQFISNLDQTSQRYVELRPQGFDAAKPFDVVVTLHGHGSDRWQYIQQERGECRGVRKIAADLNMLLVSPDYRGKTSWMGPSAEADLMQLIDILNSEYPIRHLYLAGGSMGGTSALIFSIHHPELISGVLAENATANMMEYDGFQSAIAESYNGSKDDNPEEYQRRSVELHVAKLTMPVALTVGGKDRVVPPQSVRRLASQLNMLDHPRVLLIDRPEGGHSTSFEDTVKGMRFLIDQVRLANQLDH